MTGTIQKAAEAAAESKDIARTQDLTLREAIRASSSAFEMALPQHIKVDRFIRAAFTAINVVPKLAECTQQSVLAGLMQAAQLGLEVADVRGQCYLIPRAGKATFQLGYRGMIDLAARSGITVDAEELRENDDFDFALGTKRFLHHKPTLGPRGKVLAYYATASFADARVPAFTIMSVNEIEEHRDKFASQRDKSGKIAGPWVEHFDAMARKSVIRALLNYLPVAVELRDAIHQDAVDATATEVATIDYGSSFQVPELPDGVNSATGEIADPTTVTETTETPVVECDGSASCPAPVHVDGCFAVTALPDNPEFDVDGDGNDGALPLNDKGHKK